MVGLNSKPFRQIGTQQQEIPLKKKAAHGNKWVNIRMSVRETVFLDTSSPLTQNNYTKLTATELHIEVYMYLNVTFLSR